MGDRTLAMLILRAMRAGPLHGYTISRWIHEQTGEVLAVEEGVLYPALHRLERDRLVSAAPSATRGVARSSTR